MKRDYDVGYKRPPEDFQFKKGKSGNPSGKSKKMAVTQGSHGLTSVDRLHLQAAATPVRMTRGGKVSVVSMVDAVVSAQWKAAAEGKRIVAKELMSRTHDIEVADAAQREASYKHWSQYCERWSDVPLNRPDLAEAPVLPHPRDIYISLVDMVVRIVGPMAADELPMFRASVDLRDYMLIAAELRFREEGEGDPWALELRQHAVLVHRLVPPSLGGHREGEPRAVTCKHLAMRIMTLRSLKVRQLKAERVAIRNRLEQAADLYREAPDLDFEHRLTLLAKATGALRPKRRRQKP
jgi:hypothetical protein